MARFSVLEGYLGDAYGADQYVDQEYLRTTQAAQDLIAQLQQYAGSGNMVGQTSSATVTATPTGSGIPTWALLVGAGLLAVIILKK